MARFSNNIIGIVNGLTFLLSIAILAGGIWLSTKGDSVCEKFLQWPVIGIGAFLTVLSIAGFVGSCCRITWVLCVYLFFMFLIIILIFCITVFAFVVTNKGAGQVVSNRGYKEYRLGDYSNWLQKRVNNSGNWKKIESCIQDAKICKSLADHSINERAQEFYSNNLSPIESGCCKPPTSCGFTFVNATMWTVNASSSANNTSPDCGLWSNDQNQLCYGCSACKAGVLAAWKRDWKKVAIVLIVVLVALIVVYSVACCAWRNIRRDDGYHGHNHNRLKTSNPRFSH